MKIVITFLLLPLLLFSQKSDPKSSIESDLIALNEAIYKEYVLNHDTNFFDRKVLDDFILVAAIGHAENKEQVIRGVSNLNIKTIEVTTESVICKGNSGIVVGLLKMEGTIMEKPIPGKIRYMSVFIRENEQWKLQARSMTPVRKMKKP